MTLISINPHDGSEVGSVDKTPLSEINSIVSQSQAAQKKWAALSFDERAHLVAKGCQRFAERAETIGALIHKEMGKPLAEAIGEAKECADVSHEIDEVKQAIAPERFEEAKVTSTLYRDPLGVVAAITPWNWPLAMPHWMVLPALLTGNSVILKPSEETPLTGQAYVEAFEGILPEGVLQVVHGDDAQGKALVAGDVQMIAFTGSREAGKAIMKAASSTLKRLVLELGGKDPLIVLEGADLEKAARFAARNSFRNAGQVCVSTERIFVEDAVHDAFVEHLVAAAKTIEIGPMVNARQKDHVWKHIEAAKKAGAEVRYGGDRPEGNFVKPTVLTAVDEQMRIASEETFGPVACVTRVSSPEEAVERANNTPFGLGAVLFGPENERSRALARSLNAGMIGFNRSIGGAGGTPWVGARESGYGFHSGAYGHQQFTQVRVFSERK